MFSLKLLYKNITLKWVKHEALCKNYVYVKEDPVKQTQITCVL